MPQTAPIAAYGRDALRGRPFLWKAAATPDQNNHTETTQPRSQKKGTIHPQESIHKLRQSCFVVLFSFGWMGRGKSGAGGLVEFFEMADDPRYAVRIADHKGFFATFQRASFFGLGR